MDEETLLVEKEEISEEDQENYVEQLQYLLDNRDGLDVYDMKSLSLFEDPGTGLFASTMCQVHTCVIIQLISPIFVFLNTVFQIINPDAVIGENDWSRMCRAADGWGSVWLNLTNISDKVVGVVIVFYIYLYMDRYLITWRGKCTTELFRRGYAFGLMRNPKWCALGIVINGMALALAGLASVPIIYFSQTTLDIVLNSLALFFIIEVDEYVVTQYDFMFNLDRVNAQAENGTLPFERNDSVVIINDEEAFQSAFEGYDESDQVNGWTEEKAAWLGRMGKVKKVWRKKQMVSVMFPDRLTYMFPIAALEPKEMPPVIVPYPYFTTWIGITDAFVVFSKYAVLVSCIYVIACR